MTTTLQPSNMPDSSRGGAPTGGSRTVLKWVLVALAVVVIAAIVFGAAGVAFFVVSRGEDSSSGPITVESAESTTETTTLDSSATGGGSVALVAAHLVAFGDAWEAGDWARLETLASADAVTVAREWYTEGDQVNVDSANVDSILDAGSWSDGHASCDLLYYPAQGGNALIFQVTIAYTDAEARVTDLTFAGDAG